MEIADAEGVGDDDSAGALPAPGQPPQPDKIMRIATVSVVTGLSKSTVRRRIDAWIHGDRSSYALKGGRSGSIRYADPDAVERLARELRGDGAVSDCG